jgi:hypothetical protein
VAALAVSLACAAAAQAAPGDLVSSFGQAGVATIVLPHNAFGNALVVQPDGRIVVAGTATSASGQTSDVLTARFTQQGAPDTAHGHCSAPQKSNKGARHCTRHLGVGSVSFQANAGLDKVVFDGRLSPSKKLKPGAYTLAITASAAAATSGASKLPITVLP